MIQDDLVAILARQPLFAALETSELSTLAALGRAQRVCLGELVFKEGAAGDAAFVIYSGRIRILTVGDGGKPVTLGALGPGELFGERAILADEPRMATARAAEDSVLIRIDRNDFQAFFRAHGELRPYFERLAQDRALINFLRLDTLFGATPPKLILKLFNALTEAHFPAGAALYSQGDAADGLYVVRDGEAEIEQTVDGATEMIGVRGAGEVIGERSLFGGGARSATVRARTDMDCLKITKTDLDAILADAPKVREILLEQAARLGGAISAPWPAAAAPAAPTPPLATTPETDFAGTAHRPSGRPFIRQLDGSDCAAACLAMAAGAYGKRLSLARLRDAAEIGPQGATLADVAAGAERVGFDTRALRMNYAGLRSVQLPAVAHWGGDHFVLVYEADDKRVLVADPAVGIQRLRRADFEAGWTGMALALRPTDALFGEPETRFGLGRFVSRLRPHVDLLAQAFLATVLVGALGLATPLFSQAVVDRVLGQGQADLLNVLLFGAAGAAVFMVLAAALRRYLLIHVSQRLALRLEADLFRHALKLPIGYFQRRKTGDVLTRFADNARIRDLLTGQAMQTAADALTAIVYFAVLFAYSAELAAIALVFLGLAVAVALISAPALKRNDQRLFDKTAASQSKLVETITRIGAVKAAAAETAVRWAYEETVVQEALAAYRSEKLRMVIGALSRAIGLAAGLVVLWRGAGLALSGDLSVGQLVAFMGIMALAMQPAIAVVAMWGQFQEALVSVARLADVYETAPEAAEGRAVAPLPRLRGGIQFDNVTFRYQSSAKPALANISLEVHPGETAAIVGRSGSGKSTLAGLLQRLHRPESGRIRVDGVDLASVDLRSLRRQLGVVLQEDTLFTGTIRENIALGDPEAPMERIATAAKLAAAHDFIAEFPMGYDTIVGEVGVALSGGQRQRVAIARALLHEPAILIFDEATSALDAESEAAIRRNLKAILQDRTAIVIAHRLSTVRDADVIFVLDKGAVVERGAHAELMARKGLYAYLVAQQIGE